MKKTLTGLGCAFVGIRNFRPSSKEPFRFTHKMTSFSFNPKRKRDFIEAVTPTKDNLALAKELNERFRQYVKDHACK